MPASGEREFRPVVEQEGEVRASGRRVLPLLDGRERARNRARATSRRRRRGASRSPVVVRRARGEPGCSARRARAARCAAWLGRSRALRRGPADLDHGELRLAGRALHDDRVALPLPEERAAERRVDADEARRRRRTRPARRAGTSARLRPRARPSPTRRRTRARAGGAADPRPSARPSARRGSAAAGRARAASSCRRCTRRSRCDRRARPRPRPRRRSAGARRTRSARAPRRAGGTLGRDVAEGLRHGDVTVFNVTSGPTVRIMRPPPFRPRARRAHLLLRVLPAEDRRRRATALRDRRGAPSARRLRTCRSPTARAARPGSARSSS